MIDYGASIESFDGDLETFNPDQDLKDARFHNEECVGSVTLTENVGTLIAGLLVEVEKHVVEGVHPDLMEVRDALDLLLEEKFDGVIIEIDLLFEVLQVGWEL